jgi:hypothetical protein
LIIGTDFRSFKNFGSLGRTFRDSYRRALFSQKTPKNNPKQPFLSPIPEDQFFQKSQNSPLLSNRYESIQELAESQESDIVAETIDVPDVCLPS